MREFERGLDPAATRRRSPIPARVLGYGEISTVFDIEVEACAILAFKRLRHLSQPRAGDGPLLVAYDEYNRLLREEVGLHLPAHGRSAAFVTDYRSPDLLHHPAAVAVCLHRPSRAAHCLPRER